MANFNNIPKNYVVGGIIAVAAVLVLITVVQPSNFLFKDKTDYQKQQELAAKERQEYADYLASIKPDPIASEQLFKNVIDVKEVEREVAAELGSDQTIVIPTIPDSKLAIAPRGGQAEVTNYFTTVGQLVANLKTQTDPTVKQLFNEGSSVEGYQKSYAAANSFVDQMYKLSVPAEAAPFHKAELVAVDNLRGLIGQAQNYAANAETKPWPAVYASYTIINDRQAAADAEFNKLETKYQLSQLTVPATLGDSADDSSLVKLGLVKPAQAQFAVADIPQTARYILDQALGAAFANFFSQFLPAFIDKLESNYKISNFLYYTDALVTGQYLNDYLSKYVPNSLDQSLIKRFIPQISCAGNQSDLKPIFQAKAKEFFNPNDLNPTQADFYEKLARGGEVSFSTPTGQETLFKQYASGALGQSYDAALTELLNQNGLKVPRSIAGKAIETTIGSLASTLQSSITAELNIGSYDPESIVSKIVSQGISTFEQKFIFKGAVLKEQNTCISYPQLQPVIPGALPTY